MNNHPEKDTEQAAVKNANVAFILLAGGKSRRMGFPKAELVYHGKRFLDIQLEKAAALGIKTQLAAGYSGTRCPVPVIPDNFRDMGPLAGLEACMHHITEEYCLVLGIDTIFLPVPVLQKLIDSAYAAKAPAVILEHDGWLEPLIGVYRTDLLPSVSNFLGNGNTSVRDLFEQEGGITLSANCDEACFQNINSPEDYRNMPSDQYSLVPVRAYPQSRNLSMDPVIHEVRLDVFVNDEHITALYCMNDNLPELITGYLFSEAYMNDMSMLKELKIEPAGHTARAIITKPCCFEPVPLEEYLEPDPELILRESAHLLDSNPLFKETGAVHAAGIGKTDSPIKSVFYDVSRACAVDKAIGDAVREGSGFQNSILYLTGRISVPIIDKVIQSRIPVIVSRGAASYEAIQKAKENHISLYGFSRGDRFNYYTF